MISGHDWPVFSFKQWLVLEGPDKSYIYNYIYIPGTPNNHL